MHLPRIPPWVDLHQIWFQVPVANITNCDKFFGDQSGEVEFVGRVENDWFP